MEALEAVSAHPERLLSVQEELADKFTQLTKVLYDLHKSRLALEAGSPLNELVTDHFDEEQIWQQIELQNSAVLGYFKKAVRKNVSDKELYLVEESEEEASEAEEEDLNTSDVESGDEQEDEPKASSKKAAKLDARFSDEDSDLDFDIDKLEQQNRGKSNKKVERKKPRIKASEKSVVDDQFFSLAEMEAFLEAAEKQDDGRDKDPKEEVDYFEDVGSEDEDNLFDTEETEKQETKSSRDLYYKDYFDPLEGEEDEGEHPNMEEDDEDTPDEDEEDDHNMPEDVEEMSEYDEEEPMEETEESKKAKEAFKRVTFDLSDDSEGEDVGDILGGGQKNQKDIADPSELKSSFEKREEKMAEKINTMQNQMLGEKSWQLTGEVTAQKRPENSLLSETLQFDHAIRMAPTITEETTLQLEDIIKQRIKDQVWDDVVRKEKPKENPFEFKKRLTLDHDKSKLSLAEVYEQEYLKLNQKTTEEQNPKHEEIQKMMDSLFLQLDALSNFHFIPKPAVPEIKVVSNVAAISMEEVAPVGVSEATLLAPEEIKEKNKAGDTKTTAEKTDTDKKRERRKKKLTKKLKMKEKEKRQKLAEKKREESGKKLTKQAAAANLKKLAKEGKATVLKDEGKDKALKSSQAFFSQLQDQVKLQIKGAKATQKKTRRDHELSAHKLKL